MLSWRSKEYYIFWVCVCSVIYPARNAHVPCYICRLWPRQTVPYFPTLSHKRYGFGVKKVIEQNVCSDFPYNFCVWNISHSNNNSARYCHKCTQIFMLNTSYSCQVLINWSFLSTVSKNTQISNYIKIRPVSVESAGGQTDRQTDMTHPAVAFRNFYLSIRPSVCPSVYLCLSVLPSVLT